MKPIKGLLFGSDGKVSTYSVEDLGSIPGSGRFPEEGNGNPFQYSCLKNPTDGGAQYATVHGVAKSRTQLSDFTSLHFTSFFMNNPFPQESCIRAMHSLGLPIMYMTKPTGIWRTNREITEDKLCKCVYTSFVRHRNE